MKQKRKVKSLNSSKHENWWLLATLLLLLWWVLCFWAVSLFTSSVWVEASSQEYTYKWIDDKVEVIFDLSFAPKNNLRKVVTNMYLTTGGTFYMSGKVANSSNTSVIPASATNTNLLWGDSTNIASKNVTVIWWKNNDIQQWNPSAAVLGWEWNKVLPGDNSKYGVVLLWWSGNEIWGSQDGNAVVGWNKNKIENNVKNSYILWWENNLIKANTNNAIVWWKGVTVNWLSNIFVFSDGSFAPQWSNAFYLDVFNGVSFWSTYYKWWVSSNWPVSFWKIGSATCTTDNLWVQWILDDDGCLVWCTKVSRDNGGKWELIDHWDACEQNCQWKPNCMVHIETPDPVPDYTSKCTVWNVDTGHSYHCASNLLNNYKNVLFETELIDSTTPCPDPNDKENKCVFRCEPNYHLTWDKAWGTNIQKCYADCVLPWEPWTVYKHNEVITWYSVAETSCSNSAWSHKTCKDYKAKLVCNNGEWWVANNAGKAQTKNTIYTEWTCTLNQYRCNWTYNLSQEDILSTTYIKDTMSSWNWSNTDRARSSTNAKRWIYEVCIDYDPVPDNPMVNGESCTNIDPHHYKLVGCRPWYATWTTHPYECREKCSFDGKDHYYADGRTINAYMEEQRTCGEVCRVTQITCHDGQWTEGWNTYTQDACKVNPFNCPWYSVSPATAGNNASTSSYLECETLKAGATNTDNCVSSGMMYKLNWCAANYHHNSARTACESNTRRVWCDPTGVVPWYGEEVDTYLVTQTWQGAWDDDDAWSTRAKCTTSCDDEHHGEAWSCEDNCTPNSCSDHTETSKSIEHGSYSECTIQYSDCTYWATKYKFLNSCESPYEWDGTSCKEPITCTPDSCNGYTETSKSITHGNYGYCDIVNDDCTDWWRRYKFLNSCESPYVWSGGSCVQPITCTPNSCSDHTETSKSIAHGSYSECTIQYSDCSNWATKYKFLNSCESPYVWSGGSCVQPETCTPNSCSDHTETSKSIEHGSYSYCDIVNDDCTGWWRRYKFLNDCVTNYTWNGTSCEANTRDTASCGSAPSHSTWAKSTYKQTWNGSSWTPSSKPDSTCVSTSSSTIDCSFKCTWDYKCNSDNTACEEEEDESYCWSTAYSCTNNWNATNQSAPDWASGYRWDCPDETGCYKACPSGQVLSGGNCVTRDCTVSCWSKYFTCITANGSIMSPINPRQYGSNDSAQFKWDCGPANNCTEGGASGCACNATSCSSRWLSNSYGWSTCYQLVYPEDTCMGTVACYKNGCAANGYDGYTCYATNDNVDIFDHPELYDIHALTNGYCVKAKSVDQCAGYTLDACPTTHASCDDCTSNWVKKYKITSCHPAGWECFGGLPSDQRKTWCPSNANCSECAVYYQSANSCVTSSSLYLVTSCKDPNNYTIENNECVLCSQATQGWTQGTPPTNNCHMYYTKTACGKNYYQDWWYQCSSSQNCNNWVCQDWQCQGTTVTYAEVQYFQEVLGYECSCDGDRCCCDLPASCDCSPWETRQHADSQTACQGISNCYPLQCSESGWSVDVCIW